MPYHSFDAILKKERINLLTTKHSGASKKDAKHKAAGLMLDKLEKNSDHMNTSTLSQAMSSVLGKKNFLLL